jgi:hypothetical protein
LRLPQANSAGKAVAGMVFELRMRSSILIVGRVQRLEE